MEAAAWIIALLAAGAAAAVAWKKTNQSSADRVRLETELRNTQEHARACEQRAAAAEEEQKMLHKQTAELGNQIAKLEAERAGFHDKIAFLEKAEERLKTEFQNISNRIFEDKSEKFKRQNTQEMENILKPLNESIKNFSSTFEKTDQGFSEKFGELKGQIAGLARLNENLGEQAQSLTTALKGDAKQQGNWGEFVLERVLEMSGLRAGRDYHKQAAFDDDENEKKIVDVIVHLPDGKHVVIDSKVSLTAYDGYCAAGDDGEKADLLRRHVHSVERHIKTLGDKNYQNIPNIKTPNFVLMFVPVEPAYILTVNTERDIFKKALDKNIVLACPSTLLAVLRTIHTLWQLENQNANAREIAEEAGRLYDKFAGFVGKMEKMGGQLETVRRSYDDAFKSLAQGRGNIVVRAEKIKTLGARTSKSLPPPLVEESEQEDRTPAIKAISHKDS